MIDPWWIYRRETSDGREVTVIDLLGGRGRIGINPIGSQCFVDNW
jgi:hypothetical protein